MNLSLSLSALTIIKISAQRLSSYTKTVTKLFFGKGLTKRKKNKQTNKQKTVNQIIHFSICSRKNTERHAFHMYPYTVNFI